MGGGPGKHQHVKNGDQFFRPKQSSHSECKRELDYKRQNHMIHFPALQRETTDGESVAMSLA